GEDSSERKVRSNGEQEDTGDGNRGGVKRGRQHDHTGARQSCPQAHERECAHGIPRKQYPGQWANDHPRKKACGTEACSESKWKSIASCEVDSYPGGEGIFDAERPHVREAEEDSRPD